MATFTIRFDVQPTLKAFDRLAAKAPQAIVRALNRAGHSANVAVVRDVSRDMKLRVGDVQRKTKEVKATAARQVFTVKASAARIPLIRFGASGPYPSRGRGRGVSSRGKRYPRAFIAVMKTGHRGVFERKGTARLPIRELRGASIWHVFGKYAHVGIARGHEQLIKNLKSELRFALQKTAA